jgi:heat shock protein HslJ
MKRRREIVLFFAACCLSAGCHTAKKPAQPAPPQPAVKLNGTRWILDEIGGKRVVENSKATLTFPEAGKVAGNGSCNRFMGPAELNGDKIKLGPLAGTKMMCDAPASQQETAYLKALEGAQRFAVKNGRLLIYVAEPDPPLSFHAAAAGEN